MKTNCFRSAVVLLCALSFSVLPTQGQSQQFPVATRTLKNGMKVLVRGTSTPAQPGSRTFSST